MRFGYRVTLLNSLEMKKGKLMKKIEIIILWLVSITLYGNATTLQYDGWNLIGVCQDINRTDIDMTGIYEIQDQNGSSIYTGTNAQFTNLHLLKAGYGYWVKGDGDINFESGETTKRLVQPLRRDNWNLMASCEDVAQADINMTGITELQSQKGEILYTGDWAKHSTLHNTVNGYGYWVQGNKETLWMAKSGPAISPTLADSTFTIAEDTVSGSTIGILNIVSEGDDDISAIVLSGTGSELLTVTVDGTLTLTSNAVLDYETTEVYTLTAVATNGAGDSNSVNVTINITNVIDNVPVLATPSSSSVAEDIAVGIEVVTITTNGSNGDENQVDSYTIIDGNVDTHFTISDAGVISIAKALDYEYKTGYTLKVVARNSAGESTPIDVVINVEDILDLPVGFAYQTINSANDVVETTTVDGYTIRLFTNHQATNDPQSNHVGIVINVNGIDTPLLSIQRSYIGYEMVVGVYDSKGNLVGVSNTVTLSDRTIIEVITIDQTETLKKSFLNVERDYERDYENNIVIDHVSGLMWQDHEAVRYDFSGAEAYCSDLSLGGFTDWRLPNSKELWYLVDLTHEDPAIDPIFEFVESDLYWSDHTNNLRHVNFENGYTGRSYYGDKESNYVKCVRGESAYNSISFLRDAELEIVTDNLNNIMWTDITPQNPSSTLDDDPDRVSFSEAQTYCDELSLGGYTDWKLPTIEEFYSIVEHNRTNAPYQANVFENIKIGFWGSYWSNNSQYVMNFNYGDNYAGFNSGYGFYTMCNRVNSEDTDTGIITHNGVTYGTVVSPYTGRVWLDRNLGASQVCTAYNDEACYGDYYQWGRNADGHEKSDSTSVTVPFTDITNIGSDFVIRDYILNDEDWTTADYDGSLRSTNWGKTDGTSICPIGYRVPTQNELYAEVHNNVGANVNDAFNFFLKLPAAGQRRSYWNNQQVRLWTSTPYGNYSYEYYVDGQYTGFSANHGNTGMRWRGNSVRCIAEDINIPLDKPTLITDIPESTYDEGLVIDIGGEPDTSIYVNGEYVTEMMDSGSANLILNMPEVGEYTFSIMLRDQFGNESEPLVINIKRELNEGDPDGGIPDDGGMLDDGGIPDDGGFEPEPF